MINLLVIIFQIPILSCIDLNDKMGRMVVSIEEGWRFLYFVEDKTKQVWLIAEEKIKVIKKDTDNTSER